MRIISIESTPNPNAIKIVVDGAHWEPPRSYRSPPTAADDPLASSLFAETGVTSVFLCRDFITVNKRDDDTWSRVKRRVRAVIERT